MFDILKELCAVNGTSGDEKDVSDYIIKFIEENCSTDNVVAQRDIMGNVVVFKKGKAAPSKSVMFAAHMDEVGFIITDVTDEGFLKFAPVGGIADSAVFGRKVIFKNGVVGVIGGKPVHLCDEKEKDKQPKIDDLYIDIGALDKADACEEAPFAKNKIKRGDFCYFIGEYEEFGNGKIRSKAIDDRLGCAIMLELLKSDLSYNCSFAFTVQEEIGCRGAGAAVYNLEPDICIVLEATTACDIAEVKDSDKVCELGKGAVVAFMDKGAIYDKELYNIAFETARDNKLKCQTKTKIVGANDSSTIHKAFGGVRTISLSVPCRYLHTPSCMVDKDDISQIRVLAEKLSERLAVL
ncbi:MAG: M42 family peptidase [Oscillospiraceae bacterium]|nr:M42 family peptidase [Oscillospiraceae bacterium]